ncbi:transcriptional regulator [Gracilibacillus halophilus YIM-C55.5]|uniref:Transcriptional regulator n=1 Tax=Gracilibacillus halophilus YIM-C55.5 TaxID=1308866 RepID=N4W895_9BACI|nr:helix-turn-helix domain-containing protein [Gracilibacillus halophilus]ENH96493.1 transcriptional regulator [Gracilibacillus halophilus YIM-C55.5]
MKKFSTNHYYKLIAFFIILSAVPVIITGVLSYQQSSAAIINYSEEEKKQNIFQIQTNVEQILEYVDLSVTYFVRSAQTQHYLRQDMKAATFSDFHKLRSDLNHLQTLDTGIEDIVLVSMEHRWLINNDGLQHLTHEDYDTIYSDYINTAEQSSWKVENAENIELPNATKKSCPQYINLVKKLPIRNSNPSGMVSVLIPTCELDETMAKKTEMESFIVLDESDSMIAHSNQNVIGKQSYLPPSLLESIHKDSGQGQFNFEIEETDYKVSYRVSDYNDWTYLSFVEMGDLHNKSSAIGWVTIWICGILLVLSMIISFIGSKILYKPIKKLKLAIDHTQDSPLPEHNRNQNEFELIETHINQLSNKNNQLERRMQSQINQLKQLFVMRLLQGKVSQHELPLKLKNFNYDIANGTWLTTFSLQIDSVENSKFENSDQDLLLFAINNLIEDLISTNDRLTPVVINDVQVTVLMSRCQDDAQYTHFINQKAKIIQEHIQEFFGLSASIGISKPFDSLIEAPKSFKESKEALKYRLKLGYRSIIFYENLNRKYTTLASYPTSIRNRLLDAIKLSDKSTAIEETQAFFDYLQKHDMHHQQMELYISRLLYELVELRELLGVSKQTVEYEELTVTLEDFHTFHELRNWLTSAIIFPLIDHAEARAESKNKKISDLMIQLIQDRYNEDLSLDIVAAELHYNPNYLSSIFQKETHYSFSEYLLHFRLSKAKEWLTTTNMSVKEIAEQLQYNNSQNFIRSFRKLEGITPGKYRSRYKARQA